MIGIAVILGIASITLCTANVNVENELMEIRTILIYQKREIKALRNENRVLRADVRKLAVEIDNLKNMKNHTLKTSEEYSSDQDDGIRESNFRKKLKTRISKAEVAEIERPRNIRLSPEPIAFFAYMSNSEPNPSIYHALIFDVIKTNVGGGYNEFSGIFSAPSNGLYVFTWTIYTGDHGQTGFRIYVNHDEVVGTFGETDNNQNDFDSDSGSMVVALNAHDSVYIRSSMTCTTNVISEVGARTTFAGWRLN